MRPPLVYQIELSGAIKTPPALPGVFCLDSSGGDDYGCLLGNFLSFTAGGMFAHLLTSFSPGFWYGCANRIVACELTG